MLKSLRFEVPPEVGIGEDGWLFYLGNQTVFESMYSWKPAALWNLHRWRSLILTRVKQTKALGIHYVQFIVPDKISIYREKYPRPFPPTKNSSARRIGLSLPRSVRRENWIDAQSAFLAAKSEENLYYKTDTHWCAAGYMLGYRLLCKACRVDVAPNVLAAHVEVSPAVLDLGIKCRPPIEAALEKHVFVSSARRVGQNDLVTFRETNPVHSVGTSFGSIIVMQNDAPGIDPRTLLVFGDSHLFSGLGVMLAESFRRVHFVWSSPIDWDYVNRTRPDVIVHQLSERFLRRVPVDGLDIEDFAARRLDVARSANAPATQAVLP